MPAVDPLARGIDGGHPLCERIPQNRIGVSVGVGVAVERGQQGVSPAVDGSVQPISRQSRHPCAGRGLQSTSTISSPGNALTSLGQEGLWGRSCVVMQ